MNSSWKKKTIQLDRKKIKMTSRSLKYLHFLINRTHTRARTNHINHSSEPFNFVPSSFIPQPITTNRVEAHYAFEKNRINIRLKKEKKKKRLSLNRDATPSREGNCRHVANKTRESFPLNQPCEPFHLGDPSFVKNKAHR